MDDYMQRTSHWGPAESATTKVREWKNENLVEDAYNSDLVGRPSCKLNCDVCGAAIASRMSTMTSRMHWNVHDRSTMKRVYEEEEKQAGMSLGRIGIRLDNLLSVAE